MGKMRLVLVVLVLGLLGRSCNRGDTLKDIILGHRVKRAGTGYVRRMETISTGEVILLVRELGEF